MTSTDLPPLETEARPTFTIGRLALGVVVLASFSVWIYGFSGFASRTAPDTLGSPSYLAVADPACAAANESAVAVPSALDADDNVERSGQIVATTAVYRELVDDLELLLDDPSVSLNARDRGITLEWLADWDAFLDDRLDYAERLSGDPEAVFYVAASSGGERLERRISRFATTNEMYNCVTPSDVG